jgi:hypothetical protein
MYMVGRWAFAVSVEWQLSAQLRNAAVRLRHLQINRPGTAAESHPITLH